MKEQLNALIVEFIVVVSRCWKSTTFPQDRGVYQQDAAIAGWWLAQLRDQDARSVADEILSPRIKKHFYDYWRAGECGEKEIDAFVSLTNAVEALLAKT